MNTILADDEIHKWWASENGMEDADLAKLYDFRKVIRKAEAAVLAKLRGQEPLSRVDHCEFVAARNQWKSIMWTSAPVPFKAALYAAPLPAVAPLNHQKVRDAVALLRGDGPFDVAQVIGLLDAAMTLPAVVQVPQAVAYLDIGAGGYLDLGSDLTDEQLQELPKGRHMLAIVGTFGVDGYTPAAPEAPAQGYTHADVASAHAEGYKLGLAQKDRTESHAIPAPWREAVKVAREREAFELWVFDTQHRHPTTWDAECAKMGGAVPAHKAGHYYLREDQIRWEAWCAALAQLDALEGGV